MESVEEEKQPLPAPTKLSGHSKSLLCCHVPPSSPGVVASSSQDGSVCLFDLRNKDVIQRFQCFGGEAVTSICFGQASFDIFYAAAATTVYCLDVRLGSLGRVVQKYNYSMDEINQVTLNQKASYLAVADDSGETKIIDTHSHKLQKTLKGVHTSICSTAQFSPQRPWEIVTGGLDAKIVRWDFSKGKPLKIVDVGSGAFANHQTSVQVFNPPFIHALATPEGKLSGEAGKILAVARGDGAVDICNITLETGQGSESHGSKLKGSTSAGRSKAKAMAKEAADERGSPREYTPHTSIEGHTAAVSCVTFARFALSGSFIISGSNDKTIKVWDWSQKDEETLTSSECNAIKGAQLKLCINHKKKVNWLCTAATRSENLYVTDTSKFLCVYTLL